MKQCAYRILVTTALLSALTACASVQVSIPHLGGKKDTASVPLREHTALRAATMRLTEVIPVAAVDAKKGGLHTIVFGGRDDAEREAAQFYLSGMDANAARKTVMTDADEVLSAARDVAAAGMINHADAPSETDVSLLEGAITELQQSRRLITTALKILREEGEPLTKVEIRELGDAFIQTARDIGTAADLAAARQDEGRPVYADGPSGATAGSY